MSSNLASPSADYYTDHQLASEAKTPAQLAGSLAQAHNLTFHEALTRATRLLANRPNLAAIELQIMQARAPMPHRSSQRSSLLPADYDDTPIQRRHLHLHFTRVEAEAILAVSTRQQWWCFDKGLIHNPDTGASATVAGQQCALQRALKLVHTYYPKLQPPPSNTAVPDALQRQLHKGSWTPLALTALRSCLPTSQLSAFETAISTKWTSPYARLVLGKVTLPQGERLLIRVRDTWLPLPLFNLTPPEGFDIESLNNPTNHHLYNYLTNEKA